MESFRTALGKRIILFDGAMGTEIYRRGVFINRAFEELNTSSPKLVKDIHRSYVKAGAEVITTNSFGGNIYKLAPFGLQDQVHDLNVAAGILAREAAGENAWVAASIGPTGQPLSPIGRLEPGQAYAAFKQQAAALLETKPDVFILETFYHLPELWQAVRAVRSLCDLPIIPCMTFSPSVNREEPIKEASILLREVSQWKVDGVGINCGAGPRTLLDVIEHSAKHISKPILAMPNAGQPQEVEGRHIYMASPEYMAEYARRFVQKGAQLVGGCCGTTPEIIREMKSYVRSVAPKHPDGKTPPSKAKDTPKEPPVIEAIPIAERTEFARKLYSDQFCVSVELDPPRGLDTTRTMAGAKFLKEHGIDVINIADGPRAMARMGPIALGSLAKQHCDMESVIHYCCRDRNLLGMQMDLIGANAMGLRNVLAITGDPPKMGTYPHATPVFDIDSIGLIRSIQRLNRGLDFAGGTLGTGERTSLFVGAGCNPAHIDLDLEVSRFGQKVEAGAEFFFSQPMYDDDILFEFLDRTKGFPQVPFLVGILPLASYRNAEFLHNEIPGMQVPESIRDRLQKAPTKQAQRDIGLEVAQNTLASVHKHPRISGVYIYPPFGSYKAVLTVLEALERD